MWKHSYWVSRTCGALTITNSPTGWIRAPLIKQLFSQLQNLSRVSEDILWQIAPLPYTAKFSGCGQLDLIDETKTFSILLSVKLIFLCYFHLKCFYSSREGEVDIRIGMVWMSTRVVFPGVLRSFLYLDHLICVLVFGCPVQQGWSSVFYFSLHEMQLTKWALLIWTLCSCVFLLMLSTDDWS